MDSPRKEDDLFIMDSPRKEDDLHFLDIFIDSLRKKGWLLVQVNTKSLDVLDIVEGCHLLIVDVISYLDVLDIVEGCHLLIAAEISLLHFQLQAFPSIFQDIQWCDNHNCLLPINIVGFSHMIGGFAMY